MGESPDAVTPSRISNEETADSFESTWEQERRTKRRILAWMGVYAFVVGVIVGTDPDGKDPLLDLIVGFVGLCLAIGWCLADARQRGRRMGLPMRVALVLAFAVVFPFYLLRSRGLLRGVAAILVASGWVIALAVIATLAYELTRLAK